MDTYLVWAAPPLLGALIGYLTNHIAIRMLFRPLRPWHIFGLRVPMTPGVIPSRRGQLARNIGEMVGAHLLTADDVGAAMSREPFQDHLRNLVTMRLRLLCARDFGPLEELVPQGVRGYYHSFMQLARHHLAGELGRLVHSPSFEQALARAVDEQVDLLLGREIETVLPRAQRQAGYVFLDRLLDGLLASDRLEGRLTDALRARAEGLLARGARVEDVLPRVVRLALPELVERHAPLLLERLAGLLVDPAVRERLVSGLREAIDRFLASLGPLGGMARGFLTPGTIEEKLRDYLADHEEEIRQWLHQPEVRQRLTRIVQEQLSSWLASPLAELLGEEREVRLAAICGGMARQIMATARGGEAREILAAMLRESCEDMFEQGRGSVGDSLHDLLGPDTIRSLRQGLAGELMHLLRSRELQRQMDNLSSSLLRELVGRPLGMLDRLVPEGVRERLGAYLAQSANRILLAEVPSLLDTIDVRRLVRARVDGLDLLQLERLLLSIMEEQFRAINLFGALLGFLIGCGSLLPLWFR